MEERISAVEFVFSRLSKKIKNGTYQRGDKLPTENELTEHYGVSRNTIRGAISKLAILGLVETVQGKGTFVTNRDMGTKIDNLVPLFFSGTNDYLSIIQLRGAVETLSARLAAVAATQNDIRELEKIVSDLESHKDDLEYYSKADIQFHAILAEIGKNPLVISLLSMIRSVLDDVLSDFIMEFGNTEGHRAHKRILEAIMDADADAAAAAMDKHIQALTNHYLLLRFRNENNDKHL